MDLPYSHQNAYSLQAMGPPTNTTGGVQSPPDASPGPAAEDQEDHQRSPGPHAKKAHLRTLPGADAGRRNHTVLVIPPTERKGAGIAAFRFTPFSMSFPIVLIFLHLLTGKLSLYLFVPCMAVCLFEWVVGGSSADATGDHWPLSRRITGVTLSITLVTLTVLAFAGIF